MGDSRVHTFHIPVLGLAFSIDTPLKVARYGISSVVSVVDDILIEQMRKHYTSVEGSEYVPIENHAPDSRAERIAAYLNQMHRIVQKQLAELKAMAFEGRNDLVKYFEMLAEQSPLKQIYRRMQQTNDEESRAALQAELRERLVPGEIDVNIMTKLDKVNRGKHGAELPAEQSDALAALRGFVKSDLRSSVVLSAGMNPRLFAYLGQCPEFLPDEKGDFKKKVILKVSDYRSALIQGKMLAKKGIWISEYRIESGLNCGGHAFATDGVLLGPILEDFKKKRLELVAELHGLYSVALAGRNALAPAAPFPVRITVQGGIGTAEEDLFLRDYHEVDGTGWGSPFLLVSEATNVDDDTRRKLAGASKEDFYLSGSSPLGVPFNNFRGSSSEQQRMDRIAAGKPGSPCTKKYLIANTEFTATPICTASRQYQSLKIAQINGATLDGAERARQIDRVLEKACLCEDLAAAASITCGTSDVDQPPAVAICPGPNIAYFTRMSTLEEMVGHIYGSLKLFATSDRPNMFIQELRLYIEYLKVELQKYLADLTARQQRYLVGFRSNILDGIAYYKTLLPKFTLECSAYRDQMMTDLLALESELLALVIPAA